MSTMLSIAAFEIRYYMTKISTWMYFLIFAGLCFLLVLALGGAFEGGGASIGGSDGKVFANSPYVVAAILTTVSLFGVLITAALAGHAGYRDFGEGIHPLFFTTPVSKWSWLGGRYLGTVCINAFVLTGSAVGLYFGSLWPTLEAEQFGPSMISAYVAPLLVFTLPNILLTSAIFLSLAALTRQRMPHYIGGVCLVMGYLLASGLTSDIDIKWLPAIADPFGIYAFENATEYWTTAEKNTQLVVSQGWILVNRALWIAVAFATFGVAGSLFEFQHEGWKLPRFGGKPTKTQPGSAAGGLVAPIRIELPTVTRNFTAGDRWLQYVAVTRRTFADMIRNPYFLSILLFGVLFLVVNATQIGKMYGTPTLPVTYNVVEMLGTLFGIFVVIILTFYAGELVWYERDIKVQQIVDCAPIPNWIPYLAKFTALVAVLVSLQAVVMITGLATQAFRGYYNFEIALYMKSLWGFQLIDYVFLAVLALAVHSLVNHKYMGHVIVIGFYFSRVFMGWFGFDHSLYRFGSDLGSQYSDMNAFGPYVWPFLWYKLYWGAFSVLLALGSNLVWVRGQDAAWNIRARSARGRFNRQLGAAGAAFALMTVMSGGYIFYNTNVQNTYRTSWEGEVRSAEWEKKYKQYDGAPQARITAVDIDVDIFPKSGELRSKGTFQLVNKNDGPLKEAHVQIAGRPDIATLQFDRPMTLTLDDEDQGFRIYTFDKPLAKGATAKMEWDFFYANDGFSNGGVGTSVVENGTFVNSGGICPSFGYSSGKELSSDRDRRKHGFEPKERMRDLDDPVGWQNTYISDDADWVDFKATVSTTPDQIAIAPGYLQKEWEEGGRKYFEYEMDSPILNFYSFLSARYVVEKGMWNDVPIEVYYHPGHRYNVERMIDAVAKSLEYYTREFSPYQHRQVRILEFPRYATFAQSFPNTIPYSESIGFIADVGEDDVDYPFYVTAHEIAHQWWAHQVIGADVQGSTLMSETLSQYSALMVMEEEFGPEHIRKFLAYELDNYLQGRSLEGKKELPLLRVENQQYIHYNKGALALYLIKDHIGEEALNGALSKYIDKVAFQSAPYTTSREFLSFLREATPADRQYLLDDLFLHITVYENKAVEAKAKKSGGSWEVTLDFEATKFHASDQGEQTEVGLADWIDIGVFGADDEVLYLEKHKLSSDDTTVTVTVDKEPETAGIDPWNKLIDRHPDDNVVDVEHSGT